VVSATALGIGILLSASPANALPRCVNTSNYTTQCESNGNAQIVTNPGPSAYNTGWPGWGWGGIRVRLRLMPAPPRAEWDQPRSACLRFGGLVSGLAASARYRLMRDRAAAAVGDQACRR
jgi:hypothetical protein